MLGLQYCPDDPLTDSGEAVGLTHWSRPTLQKHFLFLPLLLISRA
jgi:hypothetical protein